MSDLIDVSDEHYTSVYDDMRGVWCKCGWTEFVPNGADWTEINRRHIEDVRRERDTHPDPAISTREEQP